MTIDIGSKAPNFTLPTDGGGEISLAATLKKGPVVLYFYPKDDTPGCTQQACDFRDAMPRFGGVKATIIGLSKDSVKAHDKFKEKYAIPFTLASDENGTVCEDYGVWMEKSMYGKKYMGIDRSTFLIDQKGIVQAVWRKVKIPGHIEEVAKAAAAL